MLPEPYYRSPDGRHTIYHADCRDVLTGLLPGSVDAVVTDPPYGIDFSEATWDEPEAEHPEFIRGLVADLQGPVENGYVFLFQSVRYLSRFHEWFPEGWRILASCRGFSRMCRNDLWYAWDPVVFYHRGDKNRMMDGFGKDLLPRDFFVSNVSEPRETKNVHPCQKPVGLLRYLVQVSSPFGGLVLDPFLGSGTTSVACVQTGRRSIGIEQNERYCQIAVARMERTLAQPVLFLPERITDAQESLELTG